MDAPTIPVFVDSSKGNFRDAIDIGLDVDHPVLVAADAFPAVTIVTILASLGDAIRGIHEYLHGMPIEEEMSTLRFRMGMAEAENASMRGKIRTIEAIETVTRSQKRRTRREMDYDYWLGLPKQILNAQTEAQKPENLKHEDVGDTVMSDSKDSTVTYTEVSSQRYPAQFAIVNIGSPEYSMEFGVDGSPVMP
ncbi:hypothetical protein Tco_0733585 [Tanacetum coccineum]